MLMTAAIIVNCLLKTPNMTLESIPFFFYQVTRPLYYIFMIVFVFFLFPLLSQLLVPEKEVKSNMKNTASEKVTLSLYSLYPDMGV